MKFDDEQLRHFIYAEAHLLDQQRYPEWLSLFSMDCRYWMPLDRDQKEDDLHASLMDEDHLMLQIRVERLRGKRTFSQKPNSRSHHLLQQPEVLARDEQYEQFHLSTAFHYLESRLDQQVLLAGVMEHTLVGDFNELKIRRKTVRLLNCDAALPSIQLFI